MPINKVVIFFFIMVVVYFANSTNVNRGSDVCLLEKDAGMCRAGFLSYYFDKNKKECIRFIYGGCGGNGNNFNTYKDCIERCKKYM